MPEQRELVELLRATEARIRLTAEAADLGLWTWDREADCVTPENDRAYEIFGFPATGFQFNAACMVSEHLHPDDVGAFERAAAVTLQTGEPFFFQGRIYRFPNRELRWIELNGRLQPARDGEPAKIVGTSADITLRKQAEEREQNAVAAAVVAAEASAKFRTFFEQGTSFAGLLSLDGTVIEVNRLSLEACGFRREEVIGRKFWECPWWNRSVDLMDMVRAGVREAIEGRVFRRETPYFVADGGERVVHMTISPVTDDAGSVLYVAPTGVDITDRKQSERELQRLAMNLAVANRHQTEFLAVLAHELRNPLAPIRNGLDLLRRANDKPAMIERVAGMMERQLAQLVRLIDDLLDIARITSGKVELKKTRVDLRRILATAIETTTPMIEAAGHELRFEPPNEALLIEADATRIAQVVSNLLNNAAKYTPAGGCIKLSARREGAEVVIAVADSGVGIAPEHLGSVFGMFTQVEHNKSRAEGGLGVGLSLVRHLVELHGGRVTAESAGLGKGSTFTVRLPLTLQHKARVGEPRSRSSDPRARKLRILIVDDNVDAAASLSLLLQASGHTTEFCRDGEHALSCAHSFQPDVVFLDIGMPVMDGYELARALRQLPGLHDVFCVALTGWGTDADRIRAREAGIDRHLTKPVEISEVETVLAEVPRAGI